MAERTLIVKTHWNAKFHCRSCIVILPKILAQTFSRGDLVNVHWGLPPESTDFGQWVVSSKRHYPFSQIPKELVSLDTGYGMIESRRIYERTYQNEFNGSDPAMVSLLLIRKGELSQ